MTIGLTIFCGAWIGIVTMVVVAIALGRWLRDRDDVLKLARRDRRRADDG